MASKASMLKQGANKTGKGLFQGMTRLDAREEASSSNNTISNDISKPEKVTGQVKEVKPEPAPVKAVEAPVQEVVKEVPVVEQTVVAEPAVDEAAARREVINDTINKSEKADKKEASAVKGSSRYEKEKFLLLDIRGYRDYVEHMAKAANMSATKYIRMLIQQDMDKNNDIYLAHKALEEKLLGRSGN